MSVGSDEQAARKSRRRRPFRRLRNRGKLLQLRLLHEGLPLLRTALRLQCQRVLERDGSGMQLAGQSPHTSASQPTSSSSFSRPCSSSIQLKQSLIPEPAKMYHCCFPIVGMKDPQRLGFIRASLSDLLVSDRIATLSFPPWADRPRRDLRGDPELSGQLRGATDYDDSGLPSSDADRGSVPSLPSPTTDPR